jgi:V/A-type H+-transporting ATPase subunit I
MELLLLKSDIDAALRHLSSSRSFQVIYPDASGPGAAAQDDAFLARLDAAIAKLAQIGAFFGYAEAEIDLAGARLPDDELLAAIDKLAAFCAASDEEEQARKRRVAELEDSLREVKAFAGLSLPFEDIDKLSFVALRIGKVDARKLPYLVSALGDRAVILPLDDDGSIIAVASRKGRFALETELAKAGFARAGMPADFRGVPASALAAIEASLDEAARSLAASTAKRKAAAVQYEAEWREMTASAKLGRALKRVERRLDGTEWVYRLVGWVPAHEVKPLASDLQRMFGDRIAIRIYDPEDETAANPAGAQDVPFLYKHNGFVSGFQGIVMSYGTPVYGDIDPTPFVAFFFTLLFAIMFGDMGQGAVILALGLVIRKAKKGFLAGYSKFWPAFIAAGAGSMAMGFLVGSVFSDEAILIPIERFLTGLILGSPKDRFLEIMPSGNVASMFAFFGFTVAVGFIINSTGLVINMINLARRGEWGDALFAKTGLSGTLLFWWAAGMAVRIVVGGKLGVVDIFGIGIPVAALLFTEPLKAGVDRLRAKRRGAAADVEKEKFSAIDVLVGGLVELIETFSYYASNSMSFLRVAAFALAHAVLSFVVFTMADLVRTKAPGGVVGQFLVFIIGNAVIIGLEGLIVTIQVIRLQYYEFFSKFFTRTGKTFDPIRFDN